MMLKRRLGILVAATGCVVAAIASSACGGDARPYTPFFVEQAFRSAGIELNDLLPQTDPALAIQVEPKPDEVATVLGIGHSPLGNGKNSPRFLTVTVFPKTGAAKLWEAQERKAEADLRADPKKYPGSFPADETEITRVRNVVVVLVNRTTAQRVSRGIHAALDNLRG